MDEEQATNIDELFPKLKGESSLVPDGAKQGEPVQAEGSEPSLHQIIGTIAAVIGSDALPEPDRTELRRWAPCKPTPFAFHWLWLSYVPDKMRQESKRVGWMTIFWGIAAMGAKSHRPGRKFGAALGKSGYSRMRFERMLNATDRNRAALLMSGVHFLKAKEERFDWCDPAAFLLTTDAVKWNRIRDRIIEDYIRNEMKHAKKGS